MRGSLWRGIVELLRFDHAQPPHEIPDRSEETLFGAGPTSSRLPRSRYRDADPVKPLDRQLACHKAGPRVRDWLTGSHLMA
jgi:hypothetical protein